MRETLGFTDYQSFLRAQKPAFTETLANIIAAPDTDYTFGPTENGWGLLNQLGDTLTLFLSPDVHDRRDQLMQMGIPPEVIMNMAIDNSQAIASGQIMYILGNAHRNDLFRKMAIGLNELVESL